MYSDDEMLGLLEAAIYLPLLIIFSSLRTHEHGVPGGRGWPAGRRRADSVRSTPILTTKLLFNPCKMHIARKVMQSPLPHESFNFLPFQCDDQHTFKPTMFLMTKSKDNFNFN